MAAPAPDTAAWRQGDVWRTGFDFFYTLGNDPARMLAAARAMTALLNVALMALVFVWARSLFGWAGAVVSVLLAVFCPDLLAHAGLATSDTAAALGFTAALLAWWRLCHRVTPGRVLIAGGTLGLPLSGGRLQVLRQSIEESRATRQIAQVGKQALRVRVQAQHLFPPDLRRQARAPAEYQLQNLTAQTLRLAREVAAQVLGLVRIERRRHARGTEDGRMLPDVRLGARVQRRVAQQQPDGAQQLRLDPDGWRQELQQASRPHSQFVADP